MVREMVERRGQSSLEFMMTYGWVIVVIAVAIVVLSQWGVFNPTTNVRPTYMGFWGVVPLDFQYKTNGDLTLSFQNNVIDRDINITNVNVTVGDRSYSTGPINLYIQSGSVLKWSLSSTVSKFPGGPAGGSYNIFIAIDYIDNRIGSETTFRSSGVIQGTIEQ